MLVSRDNLGVVDPEACVNMEPKKIEFYRMRNQKLEKSRHSKQFYKHDEIFFIFLQILLYVLLYICSICGRYCIAFRQVYQICPDIWLNIGFLKRKQRHTITLKDGLMETQLLMEKLAGACGQHYVKL